MVDRTRLHFSLNPLRHACILSLAVLSVCLFLFVLVSFFFVLLISFILFFWFPFFFFFFWFPFFFFFLFLFWFRFCFLFFWFPFFFVFLVPLPLASLGRLERVSLSIVLPSSLTVFLLGFYFYS